MIENENNLIRGSKSLRIVGFSLLFFTFIFPPNLFGQATPTVTITGPEIVCPNNFHPNGSIGHTYIANAKLWGQNINCSNWEWIISENGFPVASGLGNTISNYSFPNVASYRIQFSTTCGPIPIEKNLYVTSRVKMPNPIQHVTAPIICNPGQAYTFATTPPLDLGDSTCYYHYLYEWTAPAGWSIESGGNIEMEGASVSIVAPASTPHGTYTISVKSTIPRSGQPNNPFKSAPVNYSVRVGPFNQSEMYVTGSQAVCNGNTYLYTAVVPGGHKNGYIYNWYFPSGWTVQQQLTNTITLYVPTYNSSYGPVRFSVNTGCGPPTGYSGITTYPCNYSGYGNFIVYPNPVEGEFNVEYILSENFGVGHDSESRTETNINNPQEKEFKIELYDKDQTLVKTGNSKFGKVTVETFGLNPGTYFLHIHFGKEVYTDQIIVK
ncbi:hypothetical protein Aoki45_02700 [Algoriphagus sp. oki45]|uniref:T9SS type A sorting domain-containing protein n=1 Tax=Algoriphagus sp. oki45 TaxID=3067294 RepID=UPI0027F03A0B|nr:hypothetical protein Aoki45_02700 [Algoriphagus sp. oki45]